MGDVQDRIVRDSESKRVFTGEDFLKYYGSMEEARRSFDQLTANGYFQRGKVKDTGQIVYISTSFKQTKLDNIKPDDSIHESFFSCPKTKELKTLDPLTTTETCESTCMGQGCMYLKDCPAYAKKKKEEIAHGG